MKNVFFIVLISASLLTAQKSAVDSSAIETAKDSICISDLVQKQIDLAIEKQSLQNAPVVTEAKINLIPKVAVPPLVNDPFSNFIKALPLHIQIFISASFLILLVLLIRRAVLSVKKRSMRTLKDKISSIRQERVFPKENSKLNEKRRKLKNSRSIFDTTESHISKLAKELNIAKGELLLASRLKQYETGKM